MGFKLLWLWLKCLTADATGVKVQTKGTYHNVPSTSKTTPSSLRRCMSAVNGSFNGAKKLLLAVTAACIMANVLRIRPVEGELLP